MAESKEVNLRSAQGEITRTVVKVLEDVVVVCRGEEYDRAMREQRSPIAVGFKKADIVSPGA
jgi:hypothetical protein